MDCQITAGPLVTFYMLEFRNDWIEIIVYANIKNYFQWRSFSPVVAMTCIVQQLGTASLSDSGLFSVFIIVVFILPVDF
jgi:hypothetical protein